jgi:hypothetical protein
MGVFMHLRRLLLVPLLALIITSASASAASWPLYSSKPLGFALRYPTGWKALSVSQPGGKQIQFSNPGATTYTVDVTILQLNGGTSVKVLKQRFLAFEQRIGNAPLVSVHWSHITLDRRNGIGGVYIPATEGGVAVANGVYVVPWKSRTYVVNILSVQKPSPRSLNRFPIIYKQILATWRFL